MKAVMLYSNYVKVPSYQISWACWVFDLINMLSRCSILFFRTKRMPLLFLRMFLHDVGEVVCHICKIGTIGCFLNLMNLSGNRRSRAFLLPDNIFKHAMLDRMSVFDI